MTLTDALMVFAAYLWGSIPTAYLTARLVSGIDIRKYGSGNVGASNAVIHLGTKTGLAIGLFDFIGKGVLPVLLVRFLGADIGIQAAVGLAAVIGHNWSLYIRFTGGRGIGAAGGVVLGFGMWYEALICAVLLVVLGRILLKDTGLLTLIALIALPLLAFGFGRPTEVVVLCALICTLLIAKRLTANWERPAQERPILRTMLYRILWDRDVPKRADWTYRISDPAIREASGNDTDPVLR